MNSKILKASDHYDKLQFIKNNPEPKKLDFTDMVGQFKSTKEQSWKLVPKDLSDALIKETLTKLGIRKLNQFEQDALDKAFLDSLLDKPTLKRK